MSIRFKKFIVLFFITACIAPLGDYGHVSTQATSYDWNPAPHILLSPWWFPVIVGLFAGLVGEITQQLKKRIPTPEIGISKLRAMWMGLGGVLVVYATTAVLPKEHLGVETILVSSLAFLVWALADGTLLGFIIGLLTMLSGTGSEIILVKLSAYHYHEKINLLGGVPSWLPAIHFAFGISIVKTVNFLDQIFMKSLSSKS